MKVSNIVEPFSVQSNWIIPDWTRPYPEDNLPYRPRRIDPSKPYDYIDNVVGKIKKNIPSRPLYEIKSDGKSETFEINVAGYKQEEIDISLKNHILLVTAEYENTVNGQSILVSFTLKENQFIQKIDLVNGILYIKTEFKEHDPGIQYKVGYIHENGL